MSQPYSTRFTDGGPTSAAGDHGAATVPAGKRWIIRQVASYQNTGGGGIAFWHVGSTYQLKAAPSGDATQNVEDLHLVLDAGETVAFTIVTGTWYWHAAGYELDAP